MNLVLTKRINLAITSIACASLLSGCMAAMMPAILATGAAQGSMIVGSTQSNQFAVTIDEKTFTPEMRDTLKNAEHWAIVAEDAEAAKTADLLETRGGFRVTLQRLPIKVREMMVSERRNTLSTMCSTIESDIAMLFQNNYPKETGTYLQALMGRSQHQITGTAYVLICRGKVHQTFNYAAVMNTGAYAGQSPAERDEALNKEFTNQLLLALGK